MKIRALGCVYHDWVNWEKDSRNEGLGPPRNYCEDKTLLHVKKDIIKTY